MGRAYGAHVVIDTGGVKHLYAHLSRTMVSAGQNVNAGQQIGNVGTTGNSTGPHLHYEERNPPGGYNNHRRPQFPGQSGGSSGGGSGGGGATYLSKLKSGQRDSDSVKNLQKALNAHSLRPPGNITLPVTGNFGPKTDQVVIACQQQHGFGNDRPGAVSVGPGQAAHLGLPGVRP
jgi:hypothetical protein